MVRVDRRIDVDEVVVFGQNLAVLAGRNAVVRLLTIPREQIVDHVDVSVSTTRLPLGNAREPVEHQSDIELAFALGFVVGGRDEVGEIVTTSGPVTEYVPCECDVVCAL